MTNFQPGQTVYRKDGRIVEIDHIVGEMAYVRPLHTIHYQNYHEDDFSEVDAPAEYLIPVLVSHLLDEPPTETLTEEAAKAEKRLSELNEQIQEREDAALAAQVELAKRIKELKDFDQKHPNFRFISKLMNGQQFWALEVNTLSRSIPKPVPANAPKLNCLILNRASKKLKWVSSKYHPDSNLYIKFFDTESEMQEFVRSRFEKDLNNFWKTERSERFGSKYTGYGCVKFETLKEWVNEHPFLEIPSEIEDDRKIYLAEIREAKAAELRKQLAELTSQPAREVGA